jgi:hypothetical protein
MAIGSLRGSGGLGFVNLDRRQQVHRMGLHSSMEVFTRYNCVTDRYSRHRVLVGDNAFLHVRSEPPCHQKAKVSALDRRMSKSTKRPRRRDDLNQDNSEGGEPHSKASPSTRKPRSAQQGKVETVLDTKTVSAAVDRPEASILSNLSPADESAVPKGRNLSADRLALGDNQQRSHPELRDGAERAEQVVAVSVTLPQEQALQAEESELHQPPLGLENGVEQERVQAQHPPMAHELALGSLWDTSTSSHTEPEELASGERPSHVQAVPEHGRTAAGRVKVWTGELAAHREQSARVSDQGSNPVYILTAITLGLPAVILILLVGMNPGMYDGAFMAFVTLLVLSAVVIAVVFEIKRFVDHPSDPDHA